MYKNLPKDENQKDKKLTNSSYISKVMDIEADDKVCYLYRKTRTTIVGRNGRYTFYQKHSIIIHFIKYSLSNSSYPIHLIKFFLFNSSYQIFLIK